MRRSLFMIAAFCCLSTCYDVVGGRSVEKGGEDASHTSSYMRFKISFGYEMT